RLHHWPLPEAERALTPPAFRRLGEAAMTTQFNFRGITRAVALGALLTACGESKVASTDPAPILGTARQAMGAFLSLEQTPPPVSSPEKFRPPVGTEAEFFEPVALAQTTLVHGDANDTFVTPAVFVADRLNSAIRWVDGGSGATTTLAGLSGAEGSTDGYADS